MENCHLCREKITGAAVFKNDFYHKKCWEDFNELLQAEFLKIDQERAKSKMTA